MFGKIFNSRLKIERLSIKNHYSHSISWLEDKIVDYAGGGIAYSINGEENHIWNSQNFNMENQIIEVHRGDFSFSFDSAITSDDGQYVFIYKRLGTKGLLLKNGQELREINRCYYQAETYEYPAAFATFDGKTYLIHCPFDYRRLDFEDVETGEIVTNIPHRRLNDTFHSRLEVSPDNKYFISKGWVWQPCDVLQLFNLEACLTNPHLLDSIISNTNFSYGICSASFIDNDKILLCSPEENIEKNRKLDFSIWDFKKNEVTIAVKAEGDFGNVFAINDKYCWDTYQYPKIINLTTGKVIDKAEEISTSNQRGSIILNLINKLPLIAYNRKTHKLAIQNNGMIEILWPKNL